MLIAQNAKLAFVEIPKNGSKSVKQMMQATFGLDHRPVASDLDWTPEQFEEAYASGYNSYFPQLGKINLDHLPLATVREHLPHSWAAFCAANSFALIRSPRPRFFSALLQRLGQYKGLKEVRADDPVVREEAKVVCDWLGARDTFTEREYIHFARQIDYVELDGERIVNKIFAIENTDAVDLWVAGVTGHEAVIPHEHARREPRKWAKLLIPSARFVGQKLMPGAVRKMIYPLWRGSGVFADAANRYDAVDLGPEVEAFIERYYAADAALYREACETQRAPEQVAAQ